jgi:hypothetical protein
MLAVRARRRKSIVRSDHTFEDFDGPSFDYDEMARLQEIYRLLSPSPERDITCIKEIQQAVAVIKSFQVLEKHQTRATQRQLLVLIKKLHAFVHALNDICPVYLSTFYPTSGDALAGATDVEQFRENMRTMLSSLRAESAARGRGPRQIHKYVCAWFAYDLLAKFSERHPTLTHKGPFCELAILLYKNTAGEGASDLHWQCRDVLMRKNAELSNRLG